MWPRGVAAVVFSYVFSVVFLLSHFLQMWNWPSYKLLTNCFNWARPGSLYSRSYNFLIRLSSRCFPILKAFSLLEGVTWSPLCCMQIVSYILYLVKCTLSYSRTTWNLTLHTYSSTHKKSTMSFISRDDWASILTPDDAVNLQASGLASPPLYDGTRRIHKRRLNRSSDEEEQHLPLTPTSTASFRRLLWILSFNISV